MLQVIETQAITCFKNQFIYTRFLDSTASNPASENNTFGILFSKDLENKLKTLNSTPTIVYFFHGGTVNDRQFIDLNCLENLEEKVIEQVINRNVIFVLPNIGNSFMNLKTRNWFHNEFQHSLQLALNKELKKTWMPANLPTFYTGNSMGGFAALKLSTHKNPSLLGVGSLCPALIPFSPFDQKAKEAYSQEYKVELNLMEFLIGLYKEGFQTETDFNDSNPINSDLNTLKNKKIYLSVGTQDNFAFYVGLNGWKEKLNATGIPYQYSQVENAKHDPEFLIPEVNKMLQNLL